MNDGRLRIQRSALCTRASIDSIADHLERRWCLLTNPRPRSKGYLCWRPFSLQQGALTDYFSELLIAPNMVFRLLPRPLTAARIAIEMPAAIRPFSIARAMRCEHRWGRCRPARKGAPPRGHSLPHIAGALFSLGDLLGNKPTIYRAARKIAPLPEFVRV